MTNRLQLYTAFRALGGTLNEQWQFVFSSVDDALAAVALIEAEYPEIRCGIYGGRVVYIQDK